MRNHIGEIEQRIIEETHKDGTYHTLSEVWKRYGDIIPSQTGNYEELALSFLNIFDTTTREQIKYSPWFQTMMNYRIPTHRLYEELKAVKEMISSPEPKNIITLLEMLAFGRTRYKRYKLGRFTPPTTIRNTRIHEAKSETLEIMLLSAYVPEVFHE